MAAMLIAFYALLIGVTAALKWAFDGEVWGLFLRPSAGAQELDVALGLLLGLGVAAASQYGAERLRFLREMTDALGELLRPLRHADVFGQALFSALAEEMFFRGFLQDRLGLWATALLFGVVHIPRERRLRFWQPLSILLGVALGLLFDLRGSLTAPVLAHFTINYFNMHYVLGRQNAR